MTLAALETLILRKLNDPGGVSYPGAPGAVNEAQRLFVLLTLCLETSATFPLVASQVNYNVLATLPDFLLPRRIYNSQGQRLRPCSIAELEALDSAWQSTQGLPTRYVLRGLDWLAIYPQPEAADTLAISYACCPPSVVNSSDTPSIRTQSQYALVNFSAWALRQYQGGQEFAKFADFLQEFLGEAKKVSALVRDRNADSGFETTGPFELERVK